jgi:hypothetical protein
MSTIGATSSISAVPPAPAAAAPARTPGDSKTATAASAQVELSPEALALIDKLKARDSEVRQHEQAHLAAAGSLALSGPTYTYQRGPDGVSYAVGGEVQIDTSPGRTPEETLARAQTIRAAALAPADPSGPDLAVAAAAQQLEQQARSELAQLLPQAQTDRSAEIQRAYGPGETTGERISVAA